MRWASILTTLIGKELVLICRSRRARKHLNACAKSAKRSSRHGNRNSRRFHRVSLCNLHFVTFSLGLERASARAAAFSPAVEGFSLAAEGSSLGAEDSSLGAEGFSLVAEGSSLGAEGSSLGAEGSSLGAEDLSRAAESSSIAFATGQKAAKRLKWVIFG